MSIRLRPLHPGRLFTAAALLASATLLAQTDVTTSRVSGTVRGTDGSALPAATVTAKSQETGLVRSTFTNRDGFFQILNLPTGHYAVAAALTGFHSSTEDVRLDIGSARTVDFRLSLETVQETVTVTSAVPLVEIGRASCRERV